MNDVPVLFDSLPEVRPLPVDVVNSSLFWREGASDSRSPS
jgi:hypothetical protein